MDPNNGRSKRSGRQFVSVGAGPWSRPNDPNRVNIQPASPEVISNLISSLSVISAPANHLFEQSTDHLPPPRVTSFHKPFHNPNVAHVESYTSGNGGSFGKDYGAFHQPSQNESQEITSWDELVASPPVIRTAKPPSGFSPLTAPAAPSRDSGLKSLLRGSSSRPSSLGSADDANSSGRRSAEQNTGNHDAKRASSSGSWGKKQNRNSKGLMYMSSREKLRESEKKHTSAGSLNIIANLDSFPSPPLDNGSFMAASAIREETHEEEADSPLPRMHSEPSFHSPGPDDHSPTLSSGSAGIAPMHIPTRDSSLRNRATSTRKEQSRRLSLHNGHGKQREGDEDIIREADESYETKTTSGRKKKERQPRLWDTTKKLQEPLLSPTFPDATTLASKQLSKSAMVDEHIVVSSSTELRHGQHRRPETLEPRDMRARSLERQNDRHTPDSFLRRSESQLKRLSVSPRRNTTDAGKRDSQGTRKSVTSPDPKSGQANIDDRPTSADSVDDAVEAYLCSPRLSQKIRHPQTGRVISFSEVGDPEGFAVFCCVGMGLTRYITAFYDELALTLKLRLITPDRPGVGDSEPYTDGTSTPLSWSDDVYAICQALKITKFSILAHSAGAIYALATALRMPQHIRGRIHLLAPWIPPSQLNVIAGKQDSPPTNSIPTSQRILRALPTPILKAANSSFMSATSSSLTSSLPKQKRSKNRRIVETKNKDTPSLSRRPTTPMVNADKENVGPGLTAKPSPDNMLSLAANNINESSNEASILAAAAQDLATKERQKTYDTRLTHAIWDLATSNANPAVDLLVCLERRHTIGFRYVDITRAVVIHHGSKDSRVPVENVKWLGKMMRRCEVRILEGEGHGLMASAGVMGGVLMEISREWEDWMQVVGPGDGKERVGTMRRTLRERASAGGLKA